MSTINQRKSAGKDAPAKRNGTSSNSKAEESNPDAPEAVAAGRDLDEDEAKAAAIAKAAADRIPPFSNSPWRFVPFLLLFAFLFMTISLLSTGTLDYGLQKPIMAQVNRAKIYVQEVAGLRPRPEPAALPKRFASGTVYPDAAAAMGATGRKKRQQAEKEEDGGYGGITKKKKRTQPVPGSQPLDLTGGNQAEDEQEEEDQNAPPLDIRPPAERDPTALYLTPEQLAQYRGQDSGPIFLAVHGRIFDVTEGRAFYGPGAGYSNLAGKDCSRAFATNCYNNDNLHDLRGITPEARKSIDGWYKFYAGHHKYRPVGWLDSKPVPEDAPLPNDVC
jgi:predicted heme/steroid binding protein